MKYTIYQISNGEILRTVDTSGSIEGQVNDGEDFVEGAHVSSSHYVVGGMVLERPSLSGLSIPSEAVAGEPITISGAPVGSRIFRQSITSDPFSLTINRSGITHVNVEPPFPFKSFVVVVNVQESMVAKRNRRIQDVEVFAEQLRQKFVDSRGGQIAEYREKWDEVQRWRAAGGTIAETDWPSLLPYMNEERLIGGKEMENVATEIESARDAWVRVSKVGPRIAAWRQRCKELVRAAETDADLDAALDPLREYALVLDGGIS